MENLSAAVEAVSRATELLAEHSGRNHRGCDGCLEVAGPLIVAYEAIEDAMRSGSDVRLIGSSRN